MKPAAASEPLANPVESLDPPGASRFPDFDNPSESGEVESTAVVRMRALLTAVDALLSAGLVGEARRLIRPLLDGPREARRALGS